MMEVEEPFPPRISRASKIGEREVFGTKTSEALNSTNPKKNKFLGV